jgi:predicted nucleic acid-binding protein
MKIARRIYWDTTCWLAWLNDERHWPPSVITGIQDVVYEVESESSVLFTSTITRAEIFFGKLDLNQKNLFARLMRRTNVIEVSADPRIMDRASAIREYHAARGQRVMTPDATHLATAVLYKADEFQTMDGLAASGSKRGLLKLNLDVGGYELMVINPYPRGTPPASAVSIKGPLFEKNGGERDIELGDD